MEIGIVGLPQSGKTTLFRALSGGQRSISTFASGRLEVHSVLTDVPDERLDVLERLFLPLKKTYAKVNYADIAGLEEGISQKGLPGPFINLLGQMDAFIHVVRAFENPSVPFSGGALNPARDLSVLDMEFLLHDLGAVERRQERVVEGLKKGAQDKEQGLREKELLAPGEGWSGGRTAPSRPIPDPRGSQALARLWAFVPETGAGRFEYRG